MALNLGFMEAQVYSRLENGDRPWTLELLERITHEVEA